MEFLNDLATYIRAGYPIINILSSEEDRAIDRLEDVLRRPELQKHPRELLIWSISRGFTTPDGRVVAGDESRLPEQSLALVAKRKGPALFLFKDFHPYLDEKKNAQNASLLIRLLRDLVPHLKGSLKTLVWLSPVQFIPPELEKDVTIVDMPLPAEAEYREILENIIQQVGNNPRVLVDLDEDAKDEIVKACQGLTRSEAENALAKALVSHEGLRREDVRAILGEKEQIIRKSGILEYTASVESFLSVGGLGNLKRWLAQRNEAFTQKARDFGLPNPRGVMLVGVPGCGKSLCAKAVAAEWEKPLLKFDLGRVFGSLVGESEERMRKALEVAEGVAPAVLWIDELEKGLSGIGGGGDGGVATRVFGNLLTWMVEKTRPVFVVATANDISRLPPELLRKGRIDEVFFVDLPTPRERAEILMIHLARRQRDSSEFDLRAIVDASDGFSGAELEELIIDALHAAFASAERRLTTAHLVDAARKLIPLSRSRRREIELLREWARTNARPAAIPPEEEGAQPPTDDASRRRQRRIDF
ncbi:MAG: AAA family ATPase [Pirellulaceae bacterium]|nr:AAA family ATPase [Pirellulaceae bacterium]